MFEFFAKRMRSERKRGFTLVELVIVVLILGILVGIAALSFSNVTASSKDTVAIANARAIKSAVQLSLIENGTLPSAAGDVAAVDGESAAYKGLNNLISYLEEDAYKKPVGYAYEYSVSTTDPKVATISVKKGTEVVATYTVKK